MSSGSEGIPAFEESGFDQIGKRRAVPLLPL